MSQAFAVACGSTVKTASTGPSVLISLYLPIFSLGAGAAAAR